jgi:hypothetical protein
MKDFIINEVPGPLILVSGNVVYHFKSMDVFRDKLCIADPIQCD